MAFYNGYKEGDVVKILNRDLSQSGTKNLWWVVLVKEGEWKTLELKSVFGDDQTTETIQYVQLVDPVVAVQLEIYLVIKDIRSAIYNFIQRG